MFDGVYQSVLCFFIPYLVVCLTSTAAGNGLDASDRLRLGCYIAHPAVITINLYIMLNCYRWDYALLLTIFISDASVFFWTGVYTTNTWSQFFYGSAMQVYPQLTFWMVLIVTPCACVAPRFAIKCVQKTFYPYDTDIIREQDKQGLFTEKVNQTEVVADVPLAGASSSSSQGSAKKGKHAQYASVDEDRRPIYPPSVATHNTRGQNGSDGTNYTLHRLSSEIQPSGPYDSSQEYGVRPSIDRTRPSYDRVRASMDKVRASFEASNDFTSAARLSRVESQHSNDMPTTHHRRFNLNTVRKRGMSAFSKKSVDN